MPSCKLVIRDQVNVKFEGLDPFVRKKLVDGLKFIDPSGRYTAAFQLGRWDAKVPFASASGTTFINLLDRALPIVMDAGYEIEVEDLRPDYGFDFGTVDPEIFGEYHWPEGHKNAGEPIILADHQVSAINDYLQNPQSMGRIATGAGKTILTAALSKTIEKYGRSIVIVPSKQLVSQTEEDYRLVGRDVGVFYGDRKEFHHQHTICTWQSLAVFAKKSKAPGKSKKGKPKVSKEKEAPPCSLDEFLDGVVCVIVDEAHGAKGPELKAMLTNEMADIPLRWGMTGTLPPEEFQAMALLVGIGPVVTVIRAAELQEKGILSTCDIEIFQMMDDTEKIKFKEYQDERHFIVNDAVRKDWIARFCLELSKRGNCLILVENLETGNFIQSYIPGSVFISGDMGISDRRGHYKEVSSVDDKTIIATYGVGAVGVDAPRLRWAVLVDPGRAPIRVLQSIGRLLRKGRGKTHGNVIDFGSNLKFAARQVTARKSMYKDEEFPTKVRKVYYRQADVSIEDFLPTQTQTTEE